MFFVEASVFCLFLGGFSAWLLLSDRFFEWRMRREAGRVSNFVESLRGISIDEAVGRFGPPLEQFAGSTGRGLYIWHSPPSLGFPPVRGVLIVTLTTEQDGRVTESAWQRR
jgi:hypothetical protein